MSTVAHVEVSRAGALVVATVTGEIDLANARDLRDQMLDAVGNDDRGLAIDLSAAGYIDSTGVGALFEVLRRLQARGKLLVVVAAPTAGVRRLLTITGFDGAAPVVDSVPDAEKFAP